MQDAKPRMLTNLDWENSRDDLRLLRSIKYGVPGTAMVPWGDFKAPSKDFNWLCLLDHYRKAANREKLYFQLCTNHMKLLK